MEMSCDRIPLVAEQYSLKMVVTAHALLTPRGSEWEAICDGGTVTCWNNGWQWHLRKRQDYTRMAGMSGT